MVSSVQDHSHGELRFLGATRTSSILGPDVAKLCMGTHFLLILMKKKILIQLFCSTSTSSPRILVMVQKKDISTSYSMLSAFT